MTWTSEDGWVGDSVPPALAQRAQLVLAFAGSSVFERGVEFDHCRGAFPNAIIVGCSTAGEIVGASVRDDSVVATALAFDHAQVRLADASADSSADSEAVGRRLGAQLASEPGLVHVLVISDGRILNGTALAKGLVASVPATVSVSGGLAADGERMQRTYVCPNRGSDREGNVAAIGFYGRGLRIACGSLGGWDPFGPERIVTRARDNVLYELDHRSALALYRDYLGEHAAHLPASGLLFPLSIRAPNGEHSIVRTMLGVDDEAQSITFAGDVPEGHYARLMKANFDRLVDGAYGAASLAADRLRGPAQFALLVSCVGRRMLLRQRVEEELESVREVLGPVPMAGFYSNGELGPAGVTGCELHNQTMTITTFNEVP